MLKVILLLATSLCLLSACGKKLEDSDNSGDSGSRDNIHTSAESIKARTFLATAIESNDTLLVRQALSTLESLDFVFSDGETPLTKAIKSSKSEIVNAVILKDDISNRSNKYLETPLYLIITSRRMDRFEKRDIVKRLFKQKLDINKKGSNGTTPVEVAIRSKEEGLALLLIKKGADISESYTGSRLLELANAYELSFLTKFLEEIASSEDSNLETLSNAISNGRRNLLEYLVNKNKNSAKIINENGLLITALKIQNSTERLNILVYLLRLKGVIADGMGQSETPLHYAARQFQSTHKRSLSYLLRAGANIYAKDNRGNTALDLAAFNLNLENVKYLYKRILSQSRDDFNDPNSEAGQTILSACYKTPSKKVAERILWNGKVKRYQILRSLRCPFY